MANWKQLPVVVVFLAAAAWGQAKAQPVHRAAANRGQPPPAAVPASPADRGQQVFVHNCSRCHAAPEGFPASIAATIAMHMRVRANLSAGDYKALLRFLKL